MLEKVTGKAQRLHKPRQAGRLLRRSHRHTEMSSLSWALQHCHQRAEMIWIAISLFIFFFLSERKYAGSTTNLKLEILYVSHYGLGDKEAKTMDV